MAKSLAEELQLSTEVNFIFDEKKYLLLSGVCQFAAEVSNSRLYVPRDSHPVLGQILRVLRQRDHWCRMCLGT